MRICWNSVFRSMASPLRGEILLKPRAQDYAAAIRDLHSDSDTVVLGDIPFAYCCNYGVGFLTPESLGEYVEREANGTTLEMNIRASDKLRQANSRRPKKSAEPRTPVFSPKNVHEPKRTGVTSTQPATRESALPCRVASCRGGRLFCVRAPSTTRFLTDPI